MKDILRKNSVTVGWPTEEYRDVIRRCGAMLVAEGYATEKYIQGMLERDDVFSTAIGNGIAIPHGAKEYKNEILRTGLVVLTYPDGVPWNDDQVKLVIGIAARGDEHIAILERVVDLFEDAEAVDRVVAANDAAALFELLTAESES